jgi:hypothetical protein
MLRRGLLQDLSACLLGLLIVAIETEQGVSLPPARYVAQGSEPAWDFEALIVTFAGIHPGNVGVDNQGPQLRTTASLTGSWQAVILRADPIPGTDGAAVLDPDQLADAADGNLTDLWALQSALEKVRDGAAWMTHRTPIAVGTVRPIGPGGGFVGVLGTITANLAGAR